MIIQRIKKNKLFADIGPNNFDIGPGDIKQTGPKRDKFNFKNFGPWNIMWSPYAHEDYSNFDDYFTDQDLKVIDEITKQISRYPYYTGGKFGIHPLWEWEDSGNSNKDRRNRFTIWSADINKRDRLIYLIFKTTNDILIVNCREHKIGDEDYSEALFNSPGYQKKQKSIPKIKKIINKN